MVNIKEISTENLNKVTGGAIISIWTGIAVATAIIFVSGIIDGIVHPKRCGE